MERDNKIQERKAGDDLQKASLENVTNPFENHQAVEKDVQQSAEEIENEQQFKEAQTERD